MQVQQQAATNVKLYKNETPVAETGSATLSYTYAPTEPEDVIFKAVATDGTNSVETSIAVAVFGDTETAARPADADNGVNINGSEATFVLYAPGKESVVLLGDFNDYAPSNKYMMKRDGNYFWTTVEGLEEGVEYGYQYLVDGLKNNYDRKLTDIINKHCFRQLDEFNNKRK